MLNEELRGLIRRIVRSKHKHPLTGWKPSEEPAPFLDALSDEQLDELNHLLDFNCFTVDGRGRRFGLPAGPNKRTSPQAIPDRRIVTLDERIGLADKRVLEVGCFEGVHTIALAQRARSVTALDSRVENVVKTMVRLGFYDQHARVVVYDLEKMSGAAPSWLAADVAFHVGVLYHLTDPVRHLNLLGDQITNAILLDTHVAREDQIDGEYEVDGRKYRYHRYAELGYRAVFAGMGDHAKWLLESDLNSVLRDAGFTKIERLERNEERNGRRICLLARRQVQ